MRNSQLIVTDHTLVNLNHAQNNMNINEPRWFQNPAAAYALKTLSIATGPNSTHPSCVSRAVGPFRILTISPVVMLQYWSEPKSISASTDVLLVKWNAKSSLFK